MPSKIPSTWIRKYLTASRRVREAQAQPNEEDVRSFLAEARRQGTSRPQGSIAAAVEAASESGRQDPAPNVNMNIMELYWNDRHNEAFRPEVEEVCIGVETYQESSDRQEYAFAPSPIYRSDDAREILNEMHQNEIEITNENADDIARSIKNECGQANVPQTPPGEKYDSPPRITIQDRLGPRNKDDSQRMTPIKEILGVTNSEAQRRNTPVRERLGENQFDSPPRQTMAPCQLKGQCTKFKEKHPSRTGSGTDKSHLDRKPPANQTQSREGEVEKQRPTFVSRSSSEVFQTNSSKPSRRIYVPHSRNRNRLGAGNCLSKSRLKLKLFEKAGKQPRRSFPYPTRDAKSKSPSTMTDCKVQPKNATSRGPRAALTEKDDQTQQKPPPQKAAKIKN